MQRHLRLVPGLLLFAAACSSGDDGPPAGMGVVTGKLVEYGCLRALPEVRLRVAGTTLEVMSGEAGQFRLPLPPGTWDAAIVGKGLMPEQALDGLEVKAGETLDVGEVTVFPQDLPDTCPDGSAPGYPNRGTPEEDVPGSWEEDRTDWPPLPEDDEPLPEDAPAEEDELSPEDYEEDIGENEQGLNLEPHDHAEPAFAGAAVTALPGLALPTDSPEVVRFLADLEAASDREFPDDLAIDGDELPEGAPEPGLLVSDEFGQLEQGLGRCGTIRLERVSGKGVSGGGGHCQNIPAGTSIHNYIRGVVGSEVGVLAYYKSRSGKRLVDYPKRAEAMFRTFAVAARTYVVKRTGNVKAVSVVSGPTFQCWRRMAKWAPLDRAVKGTKGQFLATKSGGRMLTSEYAASCTLQVTRPEGENGYVGASGYLRDRPRIGLYTSGGGRQHAFCGGHEGGGPCPSGSLNTTANRRVRGVCQTGSAERAMDGHDYAKILGHYQPKAQICGAGPDAGQLTPLSPKSVVVNDSSRLRFRWRDTALESSRASVEYVFTIRNPKSGATRRYHLNRKGDGERWAATKSGGDYVVSWTPSARTVSLRSFLGPRGRYEWWVTRVASKDFVKLTSPKVSFSVDEGRATIYVLRARDASVRGERFDATLLVPPRAEGGNHARVGYIDRGESAKYPYAVFDSNSGSYDDGPLAFTLYKPVSSDFGKYKFFVYDFRHAGGTSTRDIATAGTTVVYSGGGAAKVFRAPGGGYNYWEVFHMGERLAPSSDGSTAYCDFRSSTPTCVDAKP